MASYSRSVFVLTIFLAGVIMAAKAGRTSPAQPSHTIVKACSTAQYKDFCIGSLSSAPGALKADMKQLAVIAVKLSLKEAQDVSGYVVNMKKADQSSSGGLKDCVELFKDTVSELHDSLSRLKGIKKKKGSDVEDAVFDARAWLSAADTNVDTCFDGLSAHPDISRHLHTRSLYLSKLMSDALAVTHKLADKDDP
ncbi:hypothetical protein SUGI_0263350 [Cryptomeria japonica]|uniref:pectinesterase inhibitor 10 n=1 Tax=Cryptomeria japonica TaxID=3369 RepID=UPI002408A80D|nr:pectinesterase inhibitor 10 [Cryptomeria japonica]GLJ15934.1 hypothetical protein SUGI_0263350 [Cryptomeria japonica]